MSTLKQDKIKNFDPNGIGQLNDGMYGLPFTLEECETVLVPVPWEVTVSYGGGTADGPQAILDASYQVDLYDPVVKDAWKLGIGMDVISDEVRQKSDQLRNIAERYIEVLANGADANNTDLKSKASDIAKECLWLNNWVKNRCLHFLNQDKIVGLVGGDHSTPLGMMQALAEKFGNYAILQIAANIIDQFDTDGYPTKITFSNGQTFYGVENLPYISGLRSEKRVDCRRIIGRPPCGAEIPYSRRVKMAAICGFRRCVIP